MTRREIREEIFKLLFEHELIDNNIEKRINDVINEENLKKNDEIDFLRSYVTEIIENENILKQTFIRIYKTNFKCQNSI